MKMNRTNTAGRILALLLTALMVLSLAAVSYTHLTLPTIGG